MQVKDLERTRCFHARQGQFGLTSPGPQSSPFLKASQTPLSPGGEKSWRTLQSWQAARVVSLARWGKLPWLSSCWGICASHL